MMRASGKISCSRESRHIVEGADIWDVIGASVTSSSQNYDQRLNRAFQLSHRLEKQGQTTSGDKEKQSMGVAKPQYIVIANHKGQSRTDTTTEISVEPTATQNPHIQHETIDVVGGQDQPVPE